MRRCLCVDQVAAIDGNESFQRTVHQTLDAIAVGVDGDSCHGRLAPIARPDDVRDAGTHRRVSDLPQNAFQDVCLRSADVARNHGAQVCPLRARAELVAGIRRPEMNPGDRGKQR
jgi:hypothetical protein